MRKLAIVRQPDKNKRILAVIYEVLAGLTIEPDAERRIEQLVRTAMKRARISRIDSLRMLEAEDNFRLFAEQLKTEASSGDKTVGSQQIDNALSELCPLYPLC